jgi:hypothetical protein
MRGKLLDFCTRFEDVMVFLHSTADDLSSNSINLTGIKEALLHGATALEQCGVLINEGMANPPTEPDVQQLFMQIIVSSRPRLVAELDRLRVLMETASAPDEPVSEEERHLLQDALEDAPDVAGLTKAGPDFSSESSSSDDEDVKDEIPFPAMQFGVLTSAAFGFVMDETVLAKEEVQNEEPEEEGEPGEEETEEARRERQAAAIASLNAFVAFTGK